MFSKIYQWSYVVFGFSVLGGFSLMIQSLLVIDLFRFSFFHDSVLIGCMFLATNPFLLGYPICCGVFVNNSFVDLFYCFSSLYFCSDLDISFLLLNLGLVCSSSSHYLRLKIRLFFEILFFLNVGILSLMSFRAVFSVSYKFWYIMFLYFYVVVFFKIFLLISFLAIVV